MANATAWIAGSSPARTPERLSTLRKAVPLWHWPSTVRHRVIPDEADAEDPGSVSPRPLCGSPIPAQGRDDDGGVRAHIEGGSRDRGPRAPRRLGPEPGPNLLTNIHLRVGARSRISACAASGTAERSEWKSPVALHRHQLCFFEVVSDPGVEEGTGRHGRLVAHVMTPSHGTAAFTSPGTGRGRRDASGEGRQGRRACRRA